MGDTDIFAVAVRVRPRERGHPAVRPAGDAPELATVDFLPYVLRRGLPGQSGTQWFFTEAGRPFTLYVVLGSHARRAPLVPRANALLARVAVGPAPTPAPVAPWERRGTDRPVPGRLRAAGGAPVLAKAVRPGDTARAVAATVPAARSPCVAPLVAARRGGRGGRRAPPALVHPSPWTAGTGGRLLRRRSPGSWPCVLARGGPLASCGCFGTPDTPATRLHVVRRPGPGRLGRWPWRPARARRLARRRCSPASRGTGCPWCWSSLLGAWLAYLALGRLAELGAARRLLGITRGPAA